jgi:hypothetical protein
LYRSFEEASKNEVEMVARFRGQGLGQAGVKMGFVLEGTGEENRICSKFINQKLQFH